MCGIVGVYGFTNSGTGYHRRIKDATDILSHRGPDGSDLYLGKKVSLAHTRLAINDLSSRAAQPMADATGRFIIIANGEIYNHKELRKELQQQGVIFQSGSDTEVILHLYIQQGPACLQRLNGFFSFSIYDTLKDQLFIARDRFGIKPLLIYQDQDALLFASEMKALITLGIPKKIDRTSLFHYFQLNYIPPPFSIFKEVRKLEPGCYLKVADNEITLKKYYTLPQSSNSNFSQDDKTAQEELRNLLGQSVRLRLQADVPVGVLLSGGIDSSILVAEASKYTETLNTFSIGFDDAPFFDESRYAERVADHFGTSHHTFMLSEDDLDHSLVDALDSMDEPFADSSALLMYILCHRAGKEVKVVLSGDGADELFGGYFKHRAHYQAIKSKGVSKLISFFSPLLQALPKSRHSRLANTIRQLHRYSHGCSLTPKERYWFWASICNEPTVLQLLGLEGNLTQAEERKRQILAAIDHPERFSDILRTDMQLILAGDMLHKVDSMSMANSLEVRNPYLDYNLVNFAFSLEDSLKINSGNGKRILKDAYRDLLPAAITARSKKGFEVPLLHWLRKKITGEMGKYYFHEEFIKEQQLFDLDTIEGVTAQLLSSNPGDAQSQLWALIVFQHWWKKYMH